MVETDRDGGSNRGGVQDYDALVAERAAERRAEQHRLRNILAVVRSLVRRAADAAQTVEDYQLVLDGRLAAFFSVQSALSLAPERGLDLAELIGDQLLRFGIRADDHAVLDGPPICLTGRTAGLLALAFHELSVDHVQRTDAALPGTLLIAWRRHGDGVRVRWKGAHGDGLQQAIDWIAQAILYELDGSIAIDGDGGDKPCVVITLPGAALLDERR